MATTSHERSERRYEKQGGTGAVPENDQRLMCAFVSYGLGVPLMKMRDPVAARARVPVA
jgi:hypothetical protein